MNGDHHNPRPACITLRRRLGWALIVATALSPACRANQSEPPRPAGQTAAGEGSPAAPLAEPIVPQPGAEGRTLARQMYDEHEPAILSDTCGWLDDLGRQNRLFPVRAHGPQGPLWSGAACFRENGNVPGPGVRWITWGGPLWERPRPRVGHNWLLQLALPRPLPAAGDVLTVWTPDNPALRRERPPTGHLAAILDDNAEDSRNERLHAEPDYRAVAGRVTVTSREANPDSGTTQITAEIDLRFERLAPPGAVISVQGTALLVE